MMKGPTINVSYDASTNLVVTECDLKGHSNPTCFPLTSWTVISSTKNTVGYYVELERNLSQQDRFTNYVKPEKTDMYIIFLSLTPAKTTVKHSGYGEYGIVIVDFINNKVYPGRQNHSSIVWSHAWAMMICWTIGVDVMILLGRFGKQAPAYAWIHGVSNKLIYLVTLIAVFGMIAKNVADDNFFVYSAAKIHGALGIIIIILGFGQMCGGWL